MKKQTRSILQELNNLYRAQDLDHIVEAKGSNIIESAINFFQLINEKYDPETAQELERRFINSIRNGDSKKFKMGIKKIQEGESE
jgi:hypothetical protein